MKHIFAITVKFISILVILYVFLGLNFNLSFSNVVSITAVLTALGYILGDLFLLPRTNNIIATIADFGLAFFVIWFMSRALANSNDLLTASLISAAAVAIFEYVYHKIVPVKGKSNQMAEQNRPTDHNKPRAVVNFNQRPGHERLQTEVSEELAPATPSAPSRRRKNTTNKK
jgi:hypothetical protein